MCGVIPNTQYDVRVAVFYRWFGEVHVVYLAARELPGNRILPRAPRMADTFRSVKQPGMSRRGRF